MTFAFILMQNTIKVERARFNMSQQDLSEKVKVSRQTINAIELGKKVPSVELALKIARVFNQTVEAIFQLNHSSKIKTAKK